MSFWNAVVIIIAIVAFANIRMAKIRAGSSHIADGGRHDAAIAASPREQELQREVESLRERIHVLERIATEANSAKERQTQALAAEIESLRDR